MFDMNLTMRVRLRRSAAFVIGAAFVVPLAQRAGAAPVTCAIPQPCAMYTNTKGPALSGVSATSTAVLGTTNSTSTSVSSYGVEGVDANTTGSSLNSGVYGLSPLGFGVFGLSRVGTGVYGLSFYGNGMNAATRARIGKHAAIMATDQGNTGVNDGVLGIVRDGAWGVEGQSGDGASGGGVAGTATTATGVYGRSVNGTGIWAQSSSGTALYANSGSGSAILASSESGNGVVSAIASTGGKHAAVIGTDASTNGGTNDGVFGIVGNGGWGVEGQSGDGAAGGGVVGTATSGTGVVGTSLNDGVVGMSQSTDGVYGDSLDGNGLHGVAEDTDYNAFGVLGEGSFGVVGQSPYDPFMGLDGRYGHIVFDVDAQGDVSYSGMLENRTLARPGMVTTSYTTRSTAPNVENVGTGILTAGTASIRFDAAFEAAIDAHEKYQVFVTPGGATKGWLFVAAKSPTGFTVRETQGGRDSVPFDFRIVAPARGHSSEHMQLVAGIALGSPRTRKVPMRKYILPKIVRMRVPLPKR